MTTEQAHLEQTIAEMRKLNAETRLNKQNVKWYELTLFFAAIMVTVAVTKLFF